MADLKREFSWSFTRDRLFKDCRRQYYYNYYAMWGGWKRDGDEFAKQAYLLKNMKNLDMWAGEVTHQIIKWVLINKKNGIKNTYDDASGRAKWLLTKGWQQSLNKEWQSNAKYNLNLFEHYYARELSQEVVNEKLKKKVYGSLKHLFNSGFLDELDGLQRENFLNIEDLDSFIFEGVKVYASPDFAFKNGSYNLYDWKTGRASDDDKLQLSCYALYTMNKWQISLENIKVIPVYLAEESPRFIPLEGVVIEDVKNHIRQSVDVMKSVLISDVEANEIDIAKCPKTDTSWRCRNCFFQEICE